MNPNVRTHLHDAIQRTVSIDDELPEGTMLKGWVIVAEWTAPDGNGWLSRVDGSAIPEKGLPSWAMQGYLHNALFDDYGFVADED